MEEEYEEVKGMLKRFNESVANSPLAIKEEPIVHKPFIPKNESIEKPIENIETKESKWSSIQVTHDLRETMKNLKGSKSYEEFIRSLLQ
jgi:hypothetical protein